MAEHPEIAEIRQRYERRKVSYDPLAEWLVRIRQERERAYLRLFRQAGIEPPRARLLEIGCGAGSNLLFFLGNGFKADNVVGNDLLESRCAAARAALPAALRILEGDAGKLAPDQLGRFDVVTQHLVFSSILDHGFRVSLAARMWDLVAPGGGILWYDLRVNNPHNPDVRGIPLRELHGLFSGRDLKARSITLAPPIARRVCAIGSGLYSTFAAVPWLRTHIVAWIAKPGSH